MSIFIGNDSSNKNIVHITSGVSPLSEIKNGSILSNTVFHSRMALSSYRIIPLTLGTWYGYDAISNWDGYFAYTLISTWFLGIGNQDSSYGNIPAIGFQQYTMSSDDYSFLVSSASLNQKRILCLDSDYSIIETVSASSMLSFYNHYYSKKAWSVDPSTSYKFGIATFLHQEYKKVSYILIIEDEKYSPLYGEIKLTNNGFFINNYNIFSERKIVTSAPAYNSIKITEDMYLSNISSFAASNFELTTNGSVIMKIGGLPIFNSSINSFIPFKPGTVTSITQAITYGVEDYTYLIYSMKNNESFCIVYLENYYSSSRIKKTYATVTRNSTKLAILDISDKYTSNPKYMFYTYVYSSNGNVYVKTDRKNTGGASSISNTTFHIEAF